MRVRLKYGVMAWMLLVGLVVASPMLCAQDADFPGGPEGRPGIAGGRMVQGTVVGTSGDQIKIKTEGGEVYAIAVSANTRISKGRQPMKLAEIKPGDGLGAMGVLDAPTKTVHAVFVGVMDAEQVKKARENLGKTFITGKVTAMDDVKVTVKRPDGETQVIEVDETTSFRRGGRGMRGMMNGSVDTEALADGPGAAGGQGRGAVGESITLADIKVGDMVAGPGALKNGVFVPSVLHVADPAARAARRAAAGAEATAPVAPGSAPATPK